MQARGGVALLLVAHAGHKAVSLTHIWLIAAQRRSSNLFFLPLPSSPELLFSSCTLLQILLPDRSPHRTTKDHGKWGVHKEQRLVVIGDLNRTTE